MKKADFFKADKALAERVAAYINDNLALIVYRVRRDAAVNGIDAEIASYADGTMLPPSDTDVNTIIDALTAKRAAVIETFREKCMERAFSLTENDKTFYKAYKNAADKAERENAVKAFFAAYNFSIDGTSFLFDVVQNISGVKKANARTIVTSNAAVWTAPRTRNDVLNVLYCTAAEYMLAAGTLKADAIPTDIVDKFTRK